MTIKLYHMIRATNLPGVINGRVVVMPKQRDALIDTEARYMPWLTESHCVKSNMGPPWQVNQEGIRNYIATNFYDEQKWLVSDFAFLDIERPMRHLSAWYDDRGELFRDCFTIAKQAIYEARIPMSMQLGIYSLLQGPFRLMAQSPQKGVRPNQLAHHWVEPYADALCMSLYTRHAGDGDLTIDKKMADHYFDFYNDAYCHGRPRIVFIWGWNNASDTFVPMPAWTEWITYLRDKMSDGDVFCWFGVANSPFLDENYAERIRLVGEIIGAPGVEPVQSGHGRSTPTDSGPERSGGT